MSVRVLHLITGLETGGAETALQRLLAAMGQEFDHRVVSLIRPGLAGERIARTGVSVEHLGMERGVPSPGALLRLSGMLRSFRPHLLQTWLYHADLLGLLAVMLTPGVRVPVAWNLRCAYMDFSKYPRTTAWTVRACALLSRFPALVVANSRSAVEHHQSLGYRPRRVEVIPNGVDAARFAPDPDHGAARTRLRSALGLKPEDMVAGMAARFDPMKGFPVLLKALALAINPMKNQGQASSLHLALCGRGVNADNARLTALIAEHGLEGRVHLMGHVAELEHVLPGLDMYVSASLGESFPNVVAEALACGVPVAATDAGATRALVEEAGRIVPPGDAPALAGALRELAALGPERRRRLGELGRERIVNGFSMAACVARYEALYRSFAQ